MRRRLAGRIFGWLVTGLAGAILLAGSTRAQETMDEPAIRLGFHRGELFRIGPDRTRLEGFEVGADVPLKRSASDAFGVFFSPTVTLGGSNRRGEDTDGDIYRFLVNVKERIGSSGAYAGLGAGYSFTQARVHEFHNVNGPASEFILGCNFHAPHPSRSQPFLEATYHAGAHSQMSGVSIDLGVRL